MRRFPAPAAGALLLALVAFAVVAVLGRADGVTNVDDYLYALQTDAVRAGLASGGLGGLLDAWRAYGTSTPLVPTLALPLDLLSRDPDVLVLVQAVWLVVLVVGIAGLAGAVGLGPGARWATAALVGVAAPVLGYAAMLHFALAASALAVLAMWAYLASNGLRRRGPSLGLGAALGLLAISRTVALVYVAALVVAIAVDLALRRRANVLNGGLAALLGAIIAAPWWIVAGPTAWDYLTRAGYGDSAFTSDDSLPRRALDRLTWTASETGWLLAAALVVLLVLTAVALVRRRTGARRAALTLAAAVLVLAGLATSSNAGTAFALPALCLAAPALAWGLAATSKAARAPALAALAVALVLGDLALLGALGTTTVDGHPLWTQGRPVEARAHEALGCASACALPDTDALARRVAHEVGAGPTLLARSDALLNANGLRWAGATQLVASPATPTAQTLRGIRHVIAGGTLVPYVTTNGFALVAALQQAGFRRTDEVRLAPLADVQVWTAPR